MQQGGLRERKKQETRVALRTAALRLTAEHGLAGVTVDDIAATAGVSTRTFFNYFAGKEDAVVGNDPEMTAHIVALLAQRPSHEQPLVALEAVFVELATSLTHSRDVHVLRRKVMADNPSLLSRHAAAFAEFERVLIEVLRERTKDEPTSHADSALVVATAVAAMRVTVDLWVDGPADTELPEELRRVFARLAGGLVRGRTRRKIDPKPQ